MVRTSFRALSLLTIFVLAWSLSGCPSSDDCHGSAPDVEPLDRVWAIYLNEAFELQFTSAFGDDAEWSVSDGELPPGLSLDEFGLMTGTPTVEGEYTFDIQAAVDTSGSECSQHPAVGDYQFSIIPAAEG
jgi:hypothetical protein